MEERSTARRCKCGVELTDRYVRLCPKCKEAHDAAYKERRRARYQHYVHEGTCEHCGKQFTALSNVARIQRFCSDRCRQEAFRATHPGYHADYREAHRPVRHCECGRVLDRRKLTCDTCKAEGKERRKSAAVLLRMCPDCGDPMGEPRKHRCQKCRERAADEAIERANVRKRARRKRERRTASHACEVSRNTRWHVYERDQFKCHICGESVELHGDPNGDWAPCLDHVIAKAQWPKGKRGVNHVDNLKTAHRVCNSHKNVHPDDDLPEHVVRRILKRVEARCVA